MFYVSGNDQVSTERGINDIGEKGNNCWKEVLKRKTESRTLGKGLPLRGAEATLKVIARGKKESVGTSDR